MKTLIIGAAIVDILMKVKKLPEKGGDVISNSRTFAIGGCAYNVANIMQLLGADYDLFVPIGNGMYAQTIKKELIKNGHHVLIEDNSEDNGYTIGLIEPDGERTFITYTGIEGKIKPVWFDIIKNNNYDNIYFEGYRLMSHDAAILVAYLKNNKDKNLYFCPGPMINEIDGKIMKAILTLKPKVHLNDKELLAFTKTINIDDGIEKLYQLNQNEIFVTLGQNGMKYYNGKEISHFKGETIARVIDTTGAGDSHIAAVISAISKNKDIATVCYIANLVASQVVQINGPKLDEQTILKLKEVLLHV